MPSIAEIAKELKISRTHVRATIQLMEGVYILREVRTRLDGSKEYALTDEAKMAMIVAYEPTILQSQVIKGEM